MDFDDLFPVDKRLSKDGKKWNAKKTDYVKGKFSEEELDTIRNSIIQFGIANNYT